MSGLPKGWIETSLAEAGNWCSGGTPSRRRSDFFGKGIPWVKSGDLPDGPIKETEEEITAAGLNNSSAKLLPTETISMALYGATIGKLGVMTFPAATNQACANVVPNKQLVKTNYLFFYLLSQRQVFIDLGQGGAQPNISQEIVRRHPLPLPPLNEQRRIVEKLEAVLGKVDACQQRLAKIPVILMRFRQTVLAAACSGRLTADWREEQGRDVGAKQGSSASPGSDASNKKGKADESFALPLQNRGEGDGLPEVPETWRWIKLPDTGEMNRGKSRHRPRNHPSLYGGPYPFIQTGDIAQSGGKITAHKQTYSDAGLAQSRLWPAGTISITIAANIAESAILIYPACFPDSVVGIIVDSQIAVAEYVEYFIRVAKADLSTFAPATAQKNINIAILNEVSVPLPPLPEQHEIVRRVEALFTLADQLEARYLKAKTHIDRLTQSILAKAFRGELVPQDENDEPAAVLLERIRAVGAVGATRRVAQKPKATSGRGSASPLRNPDGIGRVGAGSPCPGRGNRAPTQPLPLVAETPASYGRNIPQAILSHMHPGIEYSRADIADVLGLSTSDWNWAIRQLKEEGKVVQTGERRGAKYRLL